MTNTLDLELIYNSDFEDNDDNTNIKIDMTLSPSHVNKRTKSTTRMLPDHPNLKPFNLPTNCEQHCKRIVKQQAHQYLGFCTLWDFKILNKTGNGNAWIINNRVVPLELGNVTNL